MSLASVAHKSIPVDVSRIVEHAPSELIGRENELTLLNDAWRQVISGEIKRPRVLTFVAFGGEGKTSLIAKWTADLAYEGWPDCDAAYAWSFHTQGTSSDLFLKQALTFFAENADDKQFAASRAIAYEKGRRLARIVGQKRNLVILDGLEPLQYAPTSTSPTPGELKDDGIDAFLKALAENGNGLCVVTTRYSIPDLKVFWQTSAPQFELRRLSREAGVHLLQTLGVRGSLQRNIPFNDGQETLNEFEKLVEDVKGHALTLNLIGSYLHEAHGGDIRKSDIVKLEEADAEQGGHAFRVMDAYVKSFESEHERGKRALAVLHLLGLFDRPATAGCFDALLKVPAIPNLTDLLISISEAQRNIVLTRLEMAKLLTVNREPSGALVSIDTHPLLREYFARNLRTQDLNAWRAAHRKLYEHLCATTKEGHQPTLEELQPLYQAVAHGCQAGLEHDAREKIFRDRILRGTGVDGFYSSKKLGAFGPNLDAIAWFFQIRWSRVSPSFSKIDEAWLLNAAAINLRALSRLVDAVESMRAGLQRYVELEQWGFAAQLACNLSELELILGAVTEAFNAAEQALFFSERSGSDFGQQMRSTCLSDQAYVLTQAGRFEDAAVLFQQAEQLTAEKYQLLLFSSPGFQYCEFLLAYVESAAWKEMQGLALYDQKADLIEACQAVFRRALQTRRIAEANNWLLDIALDYLSMIRAMFYEAILESSDFRHLASDTRIVDEAVDLVRRSGHQEYLPSCLMTRAWCLAAAWLRLQNREEAASLAGVIRAQTDLNEAWEIAERGPMRLHIADIRLYRARLFFRESKYPWESPEKDLTEARKLIEHCGYWRRKEELEDAEEAILGKSRVKSR